MSGHSKWNNIKRKKGAADAQRAALFTKIGREIQVAVKNGGPDPESNAKLKDVIAKAKSNNMPNDNIQRSINKAAGVGSDANYEEIQYEGYGPSGVAVIVQALTDNRNRTAADVRHLFDKFGGNMGTTGCVSFMFGQKGQCFISREDFPNEEEVLEAALNAGAADFLATEDVYVVTTEPEDYDAVCSALQDDGYTFIESTLGPVADTMVSVDEEDVAVQLEKMLDALEGHDDVIGVFHNWDH